MSKHLDKIKKQFKQETIKTFWVVLGTVGGLFTIKGIRKYTEDKETLDKIAEWVLPIVFGSGGFLLTTLTDENSKAKYLGYGLIAAGTIEGIKIIPAAKDFLGSIGTTEIPAADAYYSESEERQKLMNGFGLSELPMGNASIQDAMSYSTDLPELQGAEESTNEDLGYTGSQTEDVDLNGII